MTAYSKRLIIFDLNGTLVNPGSNMDQKMSGLFANILSSGKKIAIISGTSYKNILNQVIHSLPTSTETYSNLFIFPNSATCMYTWKGAWTQSYSENLSQEEKERIFSALESALKLSQYTKPQNYSGEIIEDRFSQITFSGTGSNTSREIKRLWDSDFSKRNLIVQKLTNLLPEYDCRVTGDSSIDITKRGINKSYGIRSLEKITGIPIDQMEYIGNSFFLEGNDYPAKATGIDCKIVTSPEMTAQIISSWI
jgi:HAD superfamily hydrolase (TIGR01484 family)